MPERNLAHVAKLDDAAQLAAVDPNGMLALTEALPEQCEEALQIALSAELPSGTAPKRIILLGMGGSAIGGELARALTEDQLKVPFAVNRDYDLPAYVDADTLVIASSYSGNTEETLTGCAEAARRGAQIVALTTGGELLQRANASNWPKIVIPGGLSPRAAIGYSLVPLLVLLERLGLAGGLIEGVREAIAGLRSQKARFGRSVPAQQNPAKQLAGRFYERLPIIYGSHGWKGVVAYRWKTQINENAKAPAYWNAFPELNHNETVGWEAAYDVTSKFEVAILRGDDDSPRIDRRIEVTSEIMAARVSGIHEFQAEGRSPVARLFSLVYPGDFASVYLAILYGIDPTPVKRIDYLKQKLSEI